MPDFHLCACCDQAIDSDCGLPELCDHCRARRGRDKAQLDHDQPAMVIIPKRIDGRTADVSGMGTLRGTVVTFR